MTNPIQGLDQADYMKLFTQELTYQDPMKPVDNKEFLTQMAQFSALQQMQTGNDLLQKLLHAHMDSQGLDLLGKKVRISGTEKEGTVTQVNLNKDAAPTIMVSLRQNNTQSPEIVRVSLDEISDIWKGVSR